MEKFLIKEKSDIDKAIQAFGKEYTESIVECVKTLPYILVGHFSDDIEFGAGCDFTSITLSEFEREPIKLYM
jgi:hypothetical protein